MEKRQTHEMKRPFIQMKNLLEAVLQIMSLFIVSKVQIHASQS